VSEKDETRRRVAPPIDEVGLERDGVAVTRLTAAQRARGRRIAVASHPAGMTHRLVYTDQLPTLALVALGASEALIGLQRAFEPVGQLLQLPTLRLVGRFRKRSILVAGQVIAVIGGLPLVAFGALQQASAPWGVWIALLALAIAAGGIVVSQTMWFPLLRGYVEEARVGHFFGLLRTVWHSTLIVYFLAAQRWLTLRPGAFAPLFAVATACGLLRIALVLGLPERVAAEEQRVRVREALDQLRAEPRLRRYLLGVSLVGGARRVAVPFLIVVMRRVFHLSDADVVLATVAFYAGGFVSLYAWGRATDLVGPRPVFWATGGGMALLYLGLLGLAPGTVTVTVMVGVFFLLAILNAGFGVADTHVLFGLAPVHAPTRLLVVADVTSSLAYGLAPLLAGLTLEAALATGAEPLQAHRAVFVACAVATLLALAPLRDFHR
jgi:MFS family permease